MNYRYTTMVPNQLFSLLPQLTGKEIKILLIILRQTVGWIDKSGARKTRDWITHTFFIQKTGLSPKSVSRAIISLIHRGYIKAESKDHYPLFSNGSRMKRGRTFYTCNLEKVGKSTPCKWQKRPSTKLTPTKIKEGVIQKNENKKKLSKQTDHERYFEIMRKRNN